MRKRTFGILTGMAVVLLLLGVAYGIAVAVSTVKLRRAYAALQADGRPMDRKEIIPPPVADTNNAALLYQSAISLLKAEPSGHSLKGPPGESVRDQIEREKHRDVLGRLSSLSSDLAEGTITPEKLQELKELMSRKSVDHALYAIEQGAQRPACRQECDYEAGTNLVTPGLTGMRSLARIVGAKARMEADAGNMDQAWHWAIVQAKLADAMRDEPILISQLVRIAMISASCEAIQRLYETAPPSMGQREQLEAILSTFDDVTPLVRAVDGERLLCGEWLFTPPPKVDLREALRDRWDPHGLDPVTSAFIFAIGTRWVTFRPFFLADHANYIQIMHKNVQILERPYSPQAPTESYKHFTLTGMLTPAMYRIGTLHWRMAAETRVTRVGLALLQYRADHEAFPATLDALKTDGLSDPFTQGPLHYRAEGDGFLLYSVAEDQKDNNGAPRPKRRSSEPTKKQHPEYDIAWRFPARTQQAAQ
jgi:hypothetical protein